MNDDPTALSGVVLGNSLSRDHILRTFAHFDNVPVDLELRGKSKAMPIAGVRILEVLKFSGLQLVAQDKNK